MGPERGRRAFGSDAPSGPRSRANMNNIETDIVQPGSPEVAHLRALACGDLLRARCRCRAGTTHARSLRRRPDASGGADRKARRRAGRDLSAGALGDRSQSRRHALARRVVRRPRASPLWRRRRLVRAIEQHARQRGFAQLYLYTTGAEKFYQRLGWELVERTDWKGFDTAFMRRVL